MRCVCHSQRSPAASTASNLLLVDALGPVLGTGRDESRIQIVEANVRAHFTGGDWDCVVGVYATEETLPSERLAALAEVCTIHRAKFAWGAFLRILSPVWVRHYDRVAVLLDDTRLPMEQGAVTRMLAVMDKHSIDMYSPAIRGAHHASTSARNSSRPCLKQTGGIEVFFTIFSTDAWLCFYARILEELNPGGCGYDLCLHQACPQLALAVDERFVAIHKKGSEAGYTRTGNPCQYRSHVHACGHGDLYGRGACMRGTGDDFAGTEAGVLPRPEYSKRHRHRHSRSRSPSRS